MGRLLAAAAFCAVFGLPALAQTPATSPPQAAARPKVGLVLSGGGARGMAHIGVLQVLEELRVPVDIVVGTSFGALVGGAYVGGAEPAELEKQMLATDWGAVLQDRLPRDELSYRRREDDALVSSRLEFGVGRDGLMLPRGAFTSAEVERLLRLLAPDSALRKVEDLPLVYRAVATDMLTGEKVVPVNVPLFTAMRASMSVPGAFAPIAVDGRILGDGGLVSNLPVALARELGAEVIIAVNLGTPLGGPETLTSALGLAQQMINILTEQNVQQSLRELRPQDVLIVPDLAGQDFLDFSAVARSIAAGSAAARAQAARLQALAVAPAVYAAYQERLQEPLKLATAPAVGSVRVESRDGAGRAVPLPHESTLRPGEPLTPAALDRAVRKLQQEREAERVDAIISGDGPTREVVLLPIDAPFGLSRLRLGLDLQADSYRTNDFTLSGLYTLGGLGERGAEWRTLLRVGAETEAQTEYYQPFSRGSPWFAILRATYRSYDADLYSDENFDLEATINIQSSALTAGFGRRLGEAGQVRLGTQYRWLRISPVLAPPQFDLTEQGISYFADLSFDTLDSLGFPTRGYLLSAAAEYFGFDPESGENFFSGRVDGLLARRAGPWAGHVYVAGQRSTSGLLPLALGGFLRLSGAPASSIIGEDVIFGRAVVAREVGSLSPTLGGAVRVGLSLEAGRAAALQPLADSPVRYGGALFVVAETRFGPLYVGVGNTHGVGTAFYLFLGSVLLPGGLLR